MIRSESIDLIAGALAKAQGEMRVPEKRRTARVRMKAEKGGGEYTYKYADLSDIREAITPALTKYGLALTQPMDAKTMELTTLLIHESGQFLGCTHELPRGLSSQVFGSAITYARRYSLCALVGIVAEDDEDGRQADDTTKRREKQNAKSEPFKPKIQQKQNGTITPVTSGPIPKNKTRNEIVAEIRDTVAVLMKLETSFDPSTEIMSKYGAQNLSSTSDEEAWDFLCWVKEEVKKRMGE